MGPELREILLATSNRGKLADFAELFEGSGVELILATDAGVSAKVEETGATFKENALIKARAIAAASGRPALGDDSGIVAYALGDEPGIYSARYAGPQCDDHANNRKLIERLRRVADRRAAFVCTLAVVLPEGTEITAEGRCEGKVTNEERGTNGFGYDPVFYCENLGCTFGEASRQAKNAHSHRGAAVRALLAELRHRGLIRG